MKTNYKPEEMRERESMIEYSELGRKEKRKEKIRT